MCVGNVIARSLNQFEALSSGDDVCSSSSPHKQAYGNNCSKGPFLGLFTMPMLNDCQIVPALNLATKLPRLCRGCQTLGPGIVQKQPQLHLLAWGWQTASKPVSSVFQELTKPAQAWLQVEKEQAAGFACHMAIVVSRNTLQACMTDCPYKISSFRLRRILWWRRWRLRFGSGRCDHSILSSETPTITKCPARLLGIPMLWCLWGTQMQMLHGQAGYGV